MSQAPATANAPQLRRDAGQVLLMADTGGGKAAVEALSSDSLELRQMALMYLAFGRMNLRMLRERIPMYVNSGPEDQQELNASNATSAIQPEAPKGLKAEAVRPFLQDPDGRLVACAGYLLALLGETDGLAPLLAYWREHAKADERCTRRLREAATAPSG